jgi:hypothetical protein
MTGSLENGSKAGDFGAVLIGSVRLTSEAPPADRTPGCAADADGGGGGPNASESSANAKLPTDAATIHDARTVETFRIPQLLRERSIRTESDPRSVHE